MTDPDLTPDEVDRICGGLKQNAAKVRFLRSLGLTVDQRPNGQPLVNRQHYDRIRGEPKTAAVGITTGNEPNWSIQA